MINAVDAIRVGGKVYVPQESYHDMLAERDELREQLEYASKQTSYDSRPCPLCKWEDGKHIEACQMHKDMDELHKQLTTATDDFATTWEALMGLEGKFALAMKALKAARELINAHHNINEGSALDWGERCEVCQGEIRNRYEESLSRLHKS